MSDEKKFYKAPGNAKYKGDVSKDVLGQVMGPTTYGSFMGAFQASYDEASDTTTVLFHTLTGDEQ
jgi:hypothetical protein